MSMVKLMRGKLVAGSQGRPHRVGSPGVVRLFRTLVVRWERRPCTCSFEKYGRVFGIAQLDVHRLQSPPSSDMDTTCRITAIIVNATRTWRLSGTNTRVPEEEELITINIDLFEQSRA